MFSSPNVCAFAHLLFSWMEEFIWFQKFTTIMMFKSSTTTKDHPPVRIHANTCSSVADIPSLWQLVRRQRQVICQTHDNENTSFKRDYVLFLFIKKVEVKLQKWFGLLHFLSKKKEFDQIMTINVIYWWKSGRQQRPNAPWLQKSVREFLVFSVTCALW